MQRSELALKRSVRTSALPGATPLWLFILIMSTIYISSDESGVFDQKHEDVFVYAGIITFSKKEQNELNVLYKKAENDIVQSDKKLAGREPKAAFFSNKEKAKAYRSLNRFYKFAVMVDLKKVRKEVFSFKKHKQRYMDYAYKIVIKRFFEMAIRKKLINPDDVKTIIVKTDEHSTATDGRYELREGLLNEFKNGTFNGEWDIYFPPIFNNLDTVELSLEDSKNKVCIRAADIVANHFHYLFTRNPNEAFKNADDHEFCIKLP